MQAMPIPVLIPSVDANLAVRQVQPLREPREGGGIEAVLSGSFRQKLGETAREILEKPGVDKPMPTETGEDDVDSQMAASYGYALFAIQSAIPSDQLILEEVNDLVGQVITSLEGNGPYPEVVEPLLARLNELLGQLETPLADNRLPLAQEILARMPQVTEQIPDESLLAELSQVLEAAGIASCPLESEDDPVLRIPAQEQPENIGAAAEVREDLQPVEEAATGERSALEQNTGRTPEEPQAAKAKAEPNKAQVAQDFAPRTLDISAQQVAATEQLQAQPPVTATRETLFDTMVQNISMDVTGAGGTVAIQLRPDFLGKVTIELAMNQGELQAKIRADDHDVRNLIAGQVNTLIQSLTEKGIKVEAMEVLYTGVEQQFQQSETGREGLNQEDRNKPLAAQKITRAEDAPDEAPLEPTMDTEISSVEYRA